MNLAAVMDEIGDALDTIAGLRVFAYSADRITPPAAVVGWPDPLTYDQAFARGADRIDLPIYLMVGRVDARSARDDLAAYLDGTGASSVKAVVDGATYTACDSVRVASATVEAITVADIEYLGAVFTVDIIGRN